ncbi:MAG TPA: RidA family protein [Gemmatimonadales bacterium]|nr:RidA family protein [Gemmatimonadales bacterium]
MSNLRSRHSSGAPWEPLVGYSRAVRVGNIVSVSGSTAAQPDGSVACVGDAYGQAKVTLQVILDALHALDARAEDVIRTRIYVTDISQWEAIGRAHGEVFGAIRPATTMVEVAKLIHPDMLVEIEADAVTLDRR